MEEKNTKQKLFKCREKLVQQLKSIIFVVYFQDRCQ